MALVSIVVPVYHNATSVAQLLEQFQQLATQGTDEWEFIFVDDGSRDESFAVLRRLAQAEPRMRVVKLSRNFGSNVAILAGLEQARGEAVAVIAADLQDPPELIGDLLALWHQGQKVVLACREGRDDPWLSTLLANTFYKLFRRFALPSMPPGGFDFFLIDRQVVDLLVGMQENNAYLMGLILWLGFTPATVAYRRRERQVQHGVSMWTLAKKLKYFMDAFAAFSSMPVRAASLAGLSLGVLGVVYAVVVVVVQLCYGTQVSGWASLMVVLLLVSGLQLVMGGVMGEYLWRNLEETRKRPRYVIETVLTTTQPAMTTTPAPTTPTDPLPSRRAG